MAQLEQGSVLEGRWEVVRPLGRGGLSTVWAARDRLRSREVALKLLAQSSAERIETLRREFALLSSAPHPSLARPLDFARTRTGLVFYTSELVAGQTLNEFARTADYAAFVRALTDALDALGFLHATRIRHGDFKPDNVLVRADGRGVLIDLSAAAELGSELGEISGTPRYLAPELVRAGRADARSDLFAVGRSLEELLPLVQNVPESAWALARRLSQSDPAARPADALEVSAMLEPQRLRTARPAGADPAELFGRERTLALAAQAIAAHAQRIPGPRLLVLSGGAGIGKSRLFRELVWRAQLELAVVEGSPARGLGDWLGRARGAAEPPAGVDSLLAAREELARGELPLVLAIDDADRLEGAERELLRALIRATRPRDALLWLITTSDPKLVEADGGCSVQLEPLSESELARWIQPRLSAARPADVLAATGGVPGLVHELLAEIARGRLRESEIARFGGSREVDPSRLAELSPDSLRALACLAIAERVSDADAPALGLEPAALAELELRGFARAEAGEYRVLGGQRLLDALPRAQTQAAHGVLIERLEALREGASASRASELSALELACHVALGDHARARALVHERQLELELAPQAWIRPLAVLSDKAGAADDWLLLAQAHEVAGDAPKALSCLARALRTRPARELRARIACRAASSYEKLGRIGRALHELERAKGADPSELGSIRARSELRAGSYREAAATAERSLTGATSVLCAELAETLGVALGYLGDQEQARRWLDQAVELRARSHSARAQARTLSYRALFAYRSGDTELAVRGFDQALALAEAHGLGDLVATSALNVGTARHQSGDWGGARRAYERGVRAAAAFGRQRTELTLRFNLAKLHADVGLHELGAALLGELERAAATALGRELEGAVLGLRAELALAGARHAEARTLLERARQLHEQRGSRRELCESELSAAELALAEAELDRAHAHVDAASGLLDALDAADLELRALTIRGRIALGRGDADGALEHVRRGSELVARVGQLELGAELDHLAADAYLSKAAPALAERKRLAAIECWERIASSLPASWADAFWRHPRRRGLRRVALAEAGDARFVLALRVLEINRRLSSTLETGEILRLAMDAAIELTGAERGFVVLKPAAKAKRLEVAIARNLDRERIGKGHLKLSHGVAKRVLDSGEPVLSVDALEDERFSRNESVHALRLRSIVCVPIRAHGQVIGALYVDNRFQRARFGPEHAEVLAAFADQVAVALSNGQLLEKLQQRTLELEQEQERVAALMRSQADEIERLAHELEREKTRTEPGRAYPEIVGQSAAIKRVLRLLDKLVESEVSVLISGESGTGKELVARAIHSGGSRSAQPFVAINCAALPEPLLESELFGHKKGAFTGAVRDHAGLFVSARGGTLFLDEIGELSLPLQAKLLRVLQERELRAVGSDEVVPLGDVRIVAASNRRLREEIALGRFRQDLYYRLSVVELELPALRERPEDVPLLARAILERTAQSSGRSPLTLSRAALAKLSAYGWPGNVRQLENVLARASVLAEGDRIEPKDLELPALGPPARQSRTRVEFKKQESERIRAALHQHRWNVCEVSRALGIPRTSLYRKLHRYGLLTER